MIVSERQPGGRDASREGEAPAEPGAAGSAGASPSPSGASPSPSAAPTAVLAIQASPEFFICLKSLATLPLRRGNDKAQPACKDFFTKRHLQLTKNMIY